MLIIFCILAAWGLLGLCWGVWGWLLPGSRQDTVIVFCTPERHPDGVIARCRWLRSLGLLPGRLLVCHRTEPAELALLRQTYEDLEFCSPAELAARLELERENLD